MATATARLSSTTGDSVASTSRAVEGGDLHPVGVRDTARPARGRPRSRPAARTARTPPSARRAAERTERVVDQHPVPAGPILVEQRDRRPVRCDPRSAAATPGSPSARPARTASGSRGASPHMIRPSRIASSHSAGRVQVVAGGRRVPLVEDEVDDLEHRRDPLRRARRPPAPRTARRRRAASSSPARCAAPSSAPGPGTRGRSPRSTGRRSSCSVSATRASRREHRVACDERQPQHVVAHGRSDLDVVHRMLGGRRGRGRSARPCVRA